MSYNNLSTDNNGNLFSILMGLTGDTPVCMVSAKTPTDVGDEIANKSIGEWVSTLWDVVLADNRDIQGHRISWGVLLFCWPDDSRSEMEAYFSDLLPGKNSSTICNQAIFSNIQGSVQDKISEVEMMNQQLLNLDFWSEHKYPYVIQNGIKRELYMSTRLS